MQIKKDEIRLISFVWACGSRKMRSGFVCVALFSLQSANQGSSCELMEKRMSTATTKRERKDRAMRKIVCLANIRLSYQWNTEDLAHYLMNGGPANK